MRGANEADPPRSEWRRAAFRVCWGLTAVYNIAWGVLMPMRNLYFRESWINLRFEQIGWLGFIRASAMIICPPLFGAATDRQGKRRPWVLAGFAMSCAVTLQYILARGFWTFAFIVFLGTASFVAYHLNINALATMTLDDRARGRQFGQYRVSGSVGYALGSSLLIPLVMRDPTYAAAFICIAGLYLICAAGAGGALRDPPMNEDEGRGWGYWRDVLKQRNLVALYVCFAVGSVGSSMGMEFFTNHLEETFGMTKSSIGRIVSLQAVFEIPPLILLGWFSDKWGRKPILIGATLAGAVRWALIGWTNTPAWIVFAQSLWGLSFSGFTVGVALIADHAPPSARGSALGLFQLSWALGYSIGPPIGGYLADRQGLPVVFLMAGCIAAASALGLALFLKNRVIDPLHPGQGQDQSPSPCQDPDRPEPAKKPERERAEAANP